MLCSKCGKETDNVSLLCDECEAKRVAESDIKKAKTFGLASAVIASVCGVFGLIFSVFAILSAASVGAWLGFLIFAVVLTALAVMLGGSSVVVYIERMKNPTKPFLTFVFGLAAMGLAVVSAILFIVSLILMLVL